MKTMSAAEAPAGAPAPTKPGRRLPLGGWGLLPLAGAIFLVAFPFASDDLFWQNMLILSMLYAIGAVGLNIISGYGGYISLGQSAFIGVGAYTVGLGALKVGGNPFLWVPAAGVVAGLFALVMGLIAMRTRGHSFVILTIGFLFLMQLVAINWDSFTNGTQGMSLPIPMWDVAYQYWPFYYALLGILALSLLTSWRIRRTKFGMGLIAMREDEDKAATVGVNTPVYKLLGFVASGVFLGMAGGVYAYFLAFIDPRGMFDIVISVLIILCMLLGGRGTLWGPVLGAFLVEPLNELANQQLGGGNSRLLIFGGLMALVVLFLPKGIVPTLQERMIARRRRGQAGLVGARLDGPLVIGERTAPAETTVAAGAPLLEVKGLTKHFGGVKAVDACSLTVPQGSITALIGPNGSGKTTAFNLIDGTMAPSAGEVWFDGRRIDGQPPYRRAHLGLGRTFQITRLFRAMTVLENVVAPMRSFSWRPAQRERHARRRGRARRGAADVRRHGALPRREGGRALLRPAEARRARAGPDARSEAHPAGRAGGRHQPDADRAHGRDDPHAQPPGHDVPDRGAQHAVRPRPLRPGARAGPRNLHLRGQAGPRAEGPAGARRLPR